MLGIQIPRPCSGMLNQIHIEQNTVVCSRQPVFLMTHWQSNVAFVSWINIELKIQETKDLF